MTAAPFLYGGLIIPHLYDLQGRENIKFLSLHVKRMDTMGKLIMIHLKYLQMIIGMPQPFYTYDSSKFDFLVDNYCTKCGVTMELTEFMIIAPQRYRDQCLMEMLFSYFTTTELCHINFLP